MATKTLKMPVGMIHSWFLPIASEPAGAHPVYGEKIDMGAARVGHLTVTTASVDVPGDDTIQVHFERFVSGQFVAETDCSDLERDSIVFGHRYENGVQISGGADSAPNGGYAFVEPILREDKSQTYRATILLKICALQSSETQTADTKQPGSIDPKTNPITYTVMEDNAGDWRMRQEFTTLDAAESWLNGLIAGGTTMHRITVLTSGSGRATPSGTYYVANNGSTVIDFGSSDPVALFDNGTTKTSSIASHKYTISSITAAHDIVAVWA